MFWLSFPLSLECVTALYFTFEEDQLNVTFPLLSTEAPKLVGVVGEIESTATVTFLLCEVCFALESERVTATVSDAESPVQLKARVALPVAPGANLKFD